MNKVTGITCPKCQKTWYREQDQPRKRLITCIACKCIFSTSEGDPSNVGQNEESSFEHFFGMFCTEVHRRSVAAGWWKDPDTKETVPAKLCLIHSEISEAMEGHRKDLMDDKIPHRKMIEVELADAVIRIGDLAGRLGLDIAGAIVEKMAYNLNRADHQLENRAKEGGKKF